MVRWRTDVATDSRVTYGPTRGSPDQVAEVAAPTTEHEVPLRGLTPGTEYCYSIGTCSKMLSESDDSQFFFTPPVPSTTQPVRIWVIGDSGTGDTNAKAVRDAYYRFAGTRHTDLWLTVGDNAYDNGTDNQYQRTLFEVYPSLSKRAVLWPSIGNHDLHTIEVKGKPVFKVKKSPVAPYHEIFTLPTHGEAGGVPSQTEYYYSFDFANVHFVCLDSEGSDRTADGPMATWLKKDLEQTRADWIIAYCHKPPYSKGHHDSDASAMARFRAAFVPILEEGGADLVLGGHCHSYERSFLLAGHYGLSETLTAAMKLDAGDGREDGSGAYKKPAGKSARNGTVYVVAGSSGKLANIPPPFGHPANYTGLLKLGSLVIDVDGHRMDVKFLRETGEVDDYFTILKGEGKTSGKTAIETDPLGSA